MPRFLPSNNSPMAYAAAILFTTMAMSTTTHRNTALAFAPLAPMNAACQARSMKGSEKIRLYSTPVTTTPESSPPSTTTTNTIKAETSKKSASSNSPTAKKNKIIKPVKTNKNGPKAATKSSNNKGKKSSRKTTTPKRSNKINKSKINNNKAFATAKKNNNKNKDQTTSTNSSSDHSNNDNLKSFKALKDLQVGSKISGKVVDVCDFGAFVNIGYATRGSRAGTALLHISQISDKRIDNIHNLSFLKQGELIEDARVISVDLAKGEVGLSLRSRRPKRRDVSTVKVGDELEGKVDSILPYGAFVDVGVTCNGLLHISRITGGVIGNIRHHLNEGDPVTVHVIDVDAGKKTLAVSMLDKKADLYLDRRLSQKMKKFYGSTGTVAKMDDDEDDEDEDLSGDLTGSELDYFDQAIRELEDALKERE